MTARHSGVLTWWNDEDNGGFGYITPAPPEGPVVVYRDELLRAGIRNPVVGTAVTFEHGIVRGDISGAARVQLADRVACLTGAAAGYAPRLPGPGRNQGSGAGENAMTMMLGLPGGNVPTAFSDAMVLLRIAADPTDATARLEALQTAYEQLTSRASDLEGREKTLDEAKAALAEAEKKFDVESEALDRDQADHDARTAELEKRERTVAEREKAVEADRKKLADDQAALEKQQRAAATQLRQWLGAVQPS
jgi:DNA repair exonuclease SbcCD ATPase subunit